MLVVVLVVQAGQLPTPTGALLRWFQSVILVSGSTQSIPTTFIIDTGAAVTLLHKDMWDKLRKLLMPWDGSPLVGVARNPLEVWGSVVVKVEIADGCSICIDS